MTRKQRVRRVLKLCCHCLRNLAYYFALRAAARNEQFFITARNNFLDTAILEWCKLFADKNGKHRWSKVVSDIEGFEERVLLDMTLTKDLFAEYSREMRLYRDKFVAHLDEEDMMHIPNMTAVLTSTLYLYDHLREHEDEGNYLHDVHETAPDMYKRFQAEGVGWHG